MTRDPVRSTLDYQLADVEKRIASATSAIVRVLCGGKPWGDEEVMRHCSDLKRALMDRWIIQRVIIELDIVDGTTP